MIDQNNINANDQALKNKIVNRALTKPAIPYISGMQLQADIMLGDLVLNTIDENGVVWVCTDLKGWWDHPEPQFQNLERGLGDGAYDVRGRYSARQITLTGVFLTPDSSYVQAAKDKLIRATDLVYTGNYLKVNEGPMKYSYVRLSGKPEIVTVNNRGRTEFSIGLRAADPIKYEWFEGGPDFNDSVDIPAKNIGLSETGTAIITNNGNTKVPVVLEITGEVTATATSPATIKNITRNELIEVVDVVTGDNALIIDTYNREVTYAPVPVGARARVGILAQWIYLDPGANEIHFEDTSNSNSTAVCRVLFSSGWIA